METSKMRKLPNLNEMSSVERRKARHVIMTQILNELRLAHTDKNKDAILIPLERFFEAD
jgi:hypothetical protein